MTIQKAQITTLKHTRDTFTVVPSSTIKQLSNPDALAILVYLLDRRRKASGWQTSFVNWIKRSADQQNNKWKYYAKPQTSADLFAAELDRLLSI